MMVDWKDAVNKYEANIMDAKIPDCFDGPIGADGKQEPVPTLDMLVFLRVFYSESDQLVLENYQFENQDANLIFNSYRGGSVPISDQSLTDGRTSPESPWDFIAKGTCGVIFSSEVENIRVRKKAATLVEGQVSGSLMKAKAKEIDYKGNRDFYRYYQRRANFDGASFVITVPERPQSEFVTITFNTLIITPQDNAKTPYKYTPLEFDPVIQEGGTGGPGSVNS